MISLLNASLMPRANQAGAAKQRSAEATAKQGQRTGQTGPGDLVARDGLALPGSSHHASQGTPSFAYQAISGNFLPPHQQQVQYPQPVIYGSPQYFHYPVAAGAPQMFNYAPQAYGMHFPAIPSYTGLSGHGSSPNYSQPETVALKANKRSSIQSDEEDRVDIDEDDGEAFVGSGMQRGRVRSTLQMTSFLASQMKHYTFFRPPKNKEERILVRQKWERALRDFNAKFEINVSMTAYRRKVSHLRRTTATKQSGKKRFCKEPSSTPGESDLRKEGSSESDVDGEEEDDVEGDE